MLMYVKNTVKLLQVQCDINYFWVLAWRQVIFKILVNIFSLFRNVRDIMFTCFL